MRRSSRFDAAFVSAGEASHVPAALLKAYAYVQTRHQMVEGQVEFEGVPARMGLMGLTPAAIDEAAALTGLDPERIRTQPEIHVRAAAALLDSHARKLGVERARLESWLPALERLVDVDPADGARSLVHESVVAALRAGVGLPLPESFAESPMLQVGIKTARQALTAAPDYAGAVWRPSPQFNSRPAPPQFVIIHSCEGPYETCIAVLSNPARLASAHYVVNEAGSEISQLVLEADRAWHVAASYDCNLNSKMECQRQGQSINDFAIGIEHAGYAAQRSWPTAQLDASAKLLCDMARDHQIPIDRYHVVAHGQVQPYNRTDPGANWPWSEYLLRAQAHCGQTVCTLSEALQTRYDELGGAAGRLGPCLAPEQPTADGVGRFGHFVGGSIYWHPETGAQAVWGAIADAWKRYGSEQGPLGYPVTGVLALPDGEGSYGDFQGGTIVWHPATGAVILSRAVAAHWKALGGVQSCLRYPTVRAKGASDGSRMTRFQGGTVTVDVAGQVSSDCTTEAAPGSGEPSAPAAPQAPEEATDTDADSGCQHTGGGFSLLGLMSVLLPMLARRAPGVRRTDMR